MEMEMIEKEKQMQKEEHHIDKKQKTENQKIDKKQKTENQKIDKKQKTENQKDAVVKARWPLKLSRNNNLDPEKSLRYHLGLGCNQRTMMLNRPACYHSPLYVTLYGYEASELLIQEDLRKLRESTASTKW